MNLHHICTRNCGTISLHGFHIECAYFNKGQISNKPHATQRTANYLIHYQCHVKNTTANDGARSREINNCRKSGMSTVQSPYYVYLG